MKANPLAPWELRISEFRVYYEIDVDSARVNIRAIGVKVHSQVYIAGEEIDL